MLAIQSDIAKHHRIHSKGAIPFQGPGLFIDSPSIAFESIASYETTYFTSQDKGLAGEIPPSQKRFVPSINVHMTKQATPV